MRIQSILVLALPVVFAMPLLGRAEPVEAKNATVHFIEDARVPAQEEGLLVKLVAQDGRPVAKDEVLAQIDDTLVNLQKDVAEAELEVAKKKWEDDISIRYAKSAAAVYRQDYIRMLDANRKVTGSVSQAEVELARLKWEQYELQAEKSIAERAIAFLEINVSKAKMTAANEHIARSTIKAPWDGVVERVVRFTGDWVKPGDPILRMIRMDKLRVTCEIDALKYSRQDVLGRPVTVRVEVTRGVFETLRGTITNCSPTIEVNNVFHAWTELENPKRDGNYILFPGMWAEMIIESGRP